MNRHPSCLHTSESLMRCDSAWEESTAPDCWSTTPLSSCKASDLDRFLDVCRVAQGLSGRTFRLQQVLRYGGHIRSAAVNMLQDRKSRYVTANIMRGVLWRFIIGRRVGCPTCCLPDDQCVVTMRPLKKPYEAAEDAQSSWAPSHVE